MYLYISILLVLVILIIYFVSNTTNLNSACIYDHNTTKSFIVVEENSVIKNIQDSINKNDGIYYIKGDSLYHNNKIVKRLLKCTKENMLFMNKKYNTDLIS